MESTVDLETLLPSPKTVIVHEGQGGKGIHHHPIPMGAVPGCDQACPESGYPTQGQDSDPGNELQHRRHNQYTLAPLIGGFFVFKVYARQSSSSPLFLA